MTATEVPCWWLSRDVALGHTLACRIGPLALDIHHAQGEWRLTHHHDDGEASAPAHATLQLREGGLDVDAGVDRFMVADPDARVALAPRLLDRPVVIRPRQPVFLPQGEQTTLYMSTPVMVSIVIGSGSRLLRELVSLPLSDTWFGPSTREGELCYAGRTHARHDRDELPRRAHRAVTPVTIRNDADAPLPLDKLSLPVQLLSLYGSEDGQLWTEAVSLVRSSASDLAALELDAAAPELAGTVTRLAEPQQSQDRSRLVRAFSALFGEGA